MLSKVCKGCEEEKAREEFTPRLRYKGGIDSRCRTCRRREQNLRNFNNLVENIEACRKWRQANPAKSAESSRKWRQVNPDRSRLASARYRLDNRDAVNARTRERSKAEAAKAAANKRQAEWAKRNPDKKASAVAMRKAKEIKATPLWANRQLIDEHYRLSRQLNMLTCKLYHVDHIVPLRGKTVCGLHVESNLQIIPASVNISKGNSHE